MSKSNSYGEAGSSFSIPTTTCSKDLAKHFGAQPQPNTKNLCKHFGEPSVPPNSPQNNTIIKGSSPSSPTRKSFIRQPTLNLNKAQPNDSETSPSNGSSNKPLRIYRIPLTNLTGTHIQSHHYHYPSTDPSKKPTAIATKMQPAKPSEPSTTLSSSHEEEEEAEGPGRSSSCEDDVNSKMSIFDQIQQDLQELSMKDKIEADKRESELRSSVLTPL
ncbi:AAEL004202-PA [Aedes aegypti]|nr:AAEL004202-PA [Aedes aegypti]